MSSYAVLSIGDVTFGYIRNTVDNRVLAAFTDDMLVREASDIGGTASGEADSVHDIRNIATSDETVRFLCPGSVVASRLDLLGVTARLVTGQLQHSIDAYADLQRDLYGEQGSMLEYLDGPEQAGRARERCDDALALTVDTWLEAVAGLNSEDWLAVGRHQPDNRSWVLEVIEEWQWHDLLRLLLLIWPTERVVLDLTNLIGGWLDPSLMPTLYGPGSYSDNGLPSIALASLRQAAATHSPIVVLTEGRTDAEFLEASLRVLHPHLQDLIRFLDYSDRPEGGAGAMVRLVKSFAAAGIANRIVALFDNDAAARDALRGLSLDSLPANIVARRYPDIALARTYPTLGPPTASAPQGQINLADVNGLAGSVEMYLGVDVLTGDDGQLSPVQWRSFISGVGVYQGEVLDKTAVHERFRSKLSRALSSGTRPTVGQHEAEAATEIGPGDWSGVAAILAEVVNAFNDR